MEDYEKISVVGRGAHGVCWLCQRKDDIYRQKVIIKTVSLEGLVQEEQNAIMGLFFAWTFISNSNIMIVRDKFSLSILFIKSTFSLI